MRLVFQQTARCIWQRLFALGLMPTLYRYYMQFFDVCQQSYGKNKKKIEKRSKKCGHLKKK